MHGFAFKSTLVTVALFSATFLNSQTFAANTATKTATLNSSAGCMGCHQGEAIAINETADKSQDNHLHKNPKQNSPHEVNKKEILPS